MSKTNDNNAAFRSGSVEIGYSNPPLQRRFKKSGNSKGRPRGSKNRKTIVKTIANEMHNVTESGKRRRLSTFELVLLRLRNLALGTNDSRASKEFHRLIKLYEPQTVNDKTGNIVVPADMSSEEWIAREQDKNRFRISPMEKDDRVKKAQKANPNFSDAEAVEQIVRELKAEKARILEEEKHSRVAEINKENPDIDQAEALRRAEVERESMLRGHLINLGRG